MSRRIFALSLAALLFACESEDERYERAVETADEQLADLTFGEVGSTAACTQDCSGHEAGFEWAKEQGVSDPSECGGDSDSFIEGCVTFAEAFEATVDDELEY